MSLSIEIEIVCFSRVFDLLFGRRSLRALGLTKVEVSIKKIKSKLLFIIPILLILYFILNLLGGNRGLFSYFEKKNYLNNLKNEEKLIRQEIEELEKSNILLSDNLDTDYIEILLRDKFLLGKKGETVYIIKNE